MFSSPPSKPLPRRIRSGLAQEAINAHPCSSARRSSCAPGSNKVHYLNNGDLSWMFKTKGMKDNAPPAEESPLLGPPEDSSDSEGTVEDAAQHVILSNWQLAGLYTTHSLSMWNSRSYEFAAVLFTTSAYPGTLTVASLRGLTANLASLLFSPIVGRWCNRYPSRLRTLQSCIIFQRICICVACLGWTLIVRPVDHDKHLKETKEEEDIDPIWMKHAIMAALILLGMFEKLSWVGNLVVMEREWVPILANDTSKPALHILNANVKRIDLISKLVAPLAVSAIVLWLKDFRLVALIIAAMQIITVGPEVTTAMKVWESAPALQTVKTIEADMDPTSDGHNSLRKKFSAWTGLIRRYITSSVCIPSIAWTVQPLSVLTLSASMMVYLLSINFPLQHITVGRTLSTAVEITSTILTPLLISWFRRRAKTTPERSAQHLQPLITVGLLGLSWQLCMLVPAVASLLILPSLPTDPTKSFPVLTKVLLVSLGLSRLGPFAYALVEQQLVQVAIPADRRLEFSGTEMALFSFAELCRWSLTGIFGKPEQFKGVALVSFGAVTMAAVLFWWWSWNWKARLHIRDVAENCNDSRLAEWPTS